MRGTPQGGVLSPIMWNMAFEGLLELFPNNGQVKIVGFADDAALVTTGLSTQYLARVMQSAVNKVVEWGKKNNLHFAPKKTASVLFTRKQKVPWDSIPRIKMGSHTVPFSSKVKYLGVVLDQKLLWTDHLRQKIDKARVLLFKVRNAAGKIWGLNPQMSIWFYRAIVRPTLQYGALVWIRKVDEKHIRTRLKKLQRLALTAMGHFRRSTPTAGLEAMTFTTPLWLHLKQEAAMAYLRTKDQVLLPRQRMDIRTHRPLTIGHRQYLSKFLNEIGYVDVPSDAIADTFNWDQNYEVDIGTGRPRHDGDLHIYTDGSKDQYGRTGAGMVQVTGDNQLVHS